MSEPMLKLEGLKELQAKLLELAGAVAGQKALLRAAHKAMEPVLADAQANAPRDTGILAESIYKVGRKPKSGSVVASVGLKIRVSSKFKELVKGFSKREVKRTVARSKRAKRLLNKQSAHWRWHFVEKGAPGRNVPAQPFLRPALAKNRQAAVNILRNELEKNIKRIARKKARAAKKAAKR